MVTLDTSCIQEFLAPGAMEAIAPRLESAHKALREKTGAGAEFTGWYTWPEAFPKGDMARILEAAGKIQRESEVFVVVGIGGSYLGAKAALDLLRSPHYNLRRKDTPDIFFAGNSLSASAMEELRLFLDGRDFSVNVISKSGSTLESAIAFRLVRQLLEQRYGARADERIYVTTDRESGSLRAQAEERGWTAFEIPGDIGGRYSVLTAAGLLPMAVAGIDIGAVLEGARAAQRALDESGLQNPAWQYAAARTLLYQGGKRIELLAYFEPSFRFLSEWWKQLFGESEGKGGGGLFPASVEYTADLHSMGQYVQDGARLMFETMLTVKEPSGGTSVPFREKDEDGLNFLAGQTLDEGARQARMGTALAHLDGGVPVLTISLQAPSEQGFAWLICFFQVACALSGYLLGVNPFDQPGVEAYKRNMFALLGKPGQEDLRETLQERMKKIGME